MDLYPQLVRNQMHGHQDYTLLLSDSVYIRLTQQQVVSLGKQIEQDQAPISDEDVSAMKAELEEIRSERG